MNRIAPLIMIALSGVANAEAQAPRPPQGPPQGPPVQQAEPTYERWDWKKAYDELYLRAEKAKVGFTAYFGCEPPASDSYAIKLPDEQRKTFGMERFNGPCIIRMKYVGGTDGFIVEERRFPVSPPKSGDKMPIPLGTEKGGGLNLRSPSSGYVAPVKPEAPLRQRFLGGRSC